jgi:hypothetical protein
MQKVMRGLLERSSVCGTVPISLFASYWAFADADRLVCWRQSKLHFSAAASLFHSRERILRWLRPGSYFGHSFGISVSKTVA